MKKLLILMLLAGTAFADTADVTFVAPTEREDNTPLAPSEIAGFHVYDTVGTQVMFLPSDARGFTTETTSATQSFYITTQDTDGRESVYSQVVVIPKTVANPKPVTGISVTIQ